MVLVCFYLDIDFCTLFLGGVLFCFLGLWGFIAFVSVCLLINLWLYCMKLVIKNLYICTYMCTPQSMHNFLVIQVTSVLRETHGLNTKVCSRELGCLQLYCVHEGIHLFRKGSYCVLCFSSVQMTTVGVLSPCFLSQSNTFLF